MRSDFLTTLLAIAWAGSFLVLGAIVLIFYVRFLNKLFRNGYDIMSFVWTALKKRKIPKLR